jgi:hypothetical protein
MPGGDAACFRRLAGLARQAVTRSAHPWRCYARGPVRYLSGRFEEATSSFRPGTDHGPSRDNPDHWLARDIAPTIIGRDEEAGHWQAKARRWFVDHPSNRDYQPHPHERSASRLLREAGELPGHGDGTAER